MRAIVLSGHGGPEVLELAEVPDPVVGPDEVLVEVAAAGVNRADLVQRAGHYPDPRRRPGDPAAEIPGLEFAGTVLEVGPRVRMWQPGDRVMGIEAGGGYAEKIAVHERQLLAVPNSVSLVEAAAIPEVFLTAWDALVVQGGLTSGRFALVHAGASGVGTAAIQIARAVGARVAVTCSASKMARCRDLGAHGVFERSPHDWASEAREMSPAGYDVVLDVVGGDEIARNLRLVADRGTVIQVGLMSGGAVAVDAGLLMARRSRWIGTTLRARPIEEKVALTRRFAAEMLPLFDTAVLRPVVDTTFPLTEAAAAQERMGANVNVGKILLTM